jgi:hypothetical protein
MSSQLAAAHTICEFWVTICFRRLFQATPRLYNEMSDHNAEQLPHPVHERSDRRSIHIGFALFCATLAVNLLNAGPGLMPVSAPDTDSYLGVVREILRGQLPNLHARTPGYPMFLLAAEAFGSWQYIVVLQALFGALAAVALWQVLAAALRAEAWAAVASFFLMAEYASAWHALALTESLSISFVIFWLYVHLADLRVIEGPMRLHPHYRWAALAADIILMMLRPAFFFLPICWYLALFVFRRLGLWRPRSARPTAISLGVVVLVALAWCAMIWGRYGRFEITIISRFNRLGNLMALGYASPDACQRKVCSPLARRGVALASSDSMRPLGPYEVTKQLAREFPRVSGGAALDTVNHVLSPPFGRMEMRAMGRVLEAFSESVWYARFPEGRLFRTRAYQAYSTYVGTELRQLSGLAIVWTVIFIGLAYRFGRERQLWIRFALLFVWFYVAGVSALGAYGDFPRLLAPAVVPLNALILLLLFDLVRGTLWMLRQESLT